jgi:hypothetical protein
MADNSSITLNDEEREWQTRIREYVNKIFAYHRGDRSDKQFNPWEAEKEASRLAHQLHMSLKKSGKEPKHHAYMIKNRELSPDNEKFYDHVHALEDLLAFLDNPNANVDPEDKTLGEDFEIRIFSPRWGHEDVYNLKRTNSGWELGGTTKRGSCDFSGHPFLYQTMRNDLVEYPASLPSYLKYLWYSAKEKGLTKEEVQEALDLLAGWVRSVSRTKPNNDRVWGGYL